jgi:predicted N-acetyltransferase YhbS
VDTEIRGLRDDEYPALYSAITRVMGAPRTYFAAHYRHDPEARAEHSRVLLVDSQIVSHIRLYDRWQRVGGVPVHVGCVGDVCTLPEHRKQGYCRALLDDALAYWDARDYDLSMIVSGVGVYERCGWVSFPEMAYRAPAVDCEPGDPIGDYAVRRFARGDDLGAVAAVYDAYHRERSLATVRSRDYWERHFYWLAREREDAFFVAERDSQIVAYIRAQHGGDTHIVSECCHHPDHPHAVHPLCAAAFTFARRARCQFVEAVLPEDHPAVDFFTDQPTWIAEERSPLLFRLVNLPRLLRRLQPLFTRRLREARLPRSALTLSVGDQMAGLAIMPDGVRIGAPAGPVVSLRPADFFLLLFGQANASEVLGGVRQSRGIRRGCSDGSRDRVEGTSVISVSLGRRRQHESWEHESSVAGAAAESHDPQAALSALFPAGAPIYWRTDIV